MGVFAAESLVGGRRKQEDFFVAEKHRNSVLLGVFDGLGGHLKGEVASQTAGNAVLGYVRRRFTVNTPKQELVRDAVLHASGEVKKIPVSAGEKQAWVRHVVQKFGPNWATADPSPKTTSTVGLIDKNRLNIAHVGDAGAKLYRNRVLSSLTTPEHDHSQTHFLNRVLPLEQGQTPALAQENLQPGDIVLFHSDGLDVLGEDEIKAVLDRFSGRLRNSKKRNALLQKAASALAKRADEVGTQLRGGKHDNITVVLYYHQPQ